MKTPGQRIKEIRNVLEKKPGKKISQQKLGKNAGVTKAAVSQWERESTLPERDPLLSMQRNIGINPDWVINGHGEMFLNKNPAEPKQTNFTEVIETGIHSLTADEIKLIKSYRLIKAEQQEYVQLSISTLIHQNLERTPPKKQA